MKRCAAVICGWLAVQAWPARAGAQVLDLGGPMAPPVLEEPNYVSSLRADLAEEIERWRAGGAAGDASQRLIAETHIAVRTAAAALMADATGEAGAGDAAAWRVFVGIRLAHDREAIDQALERILAPDEAWSAAQLGKLASSLRSFASGAEALAARAALLSDAELDHALAGAFAPLAEAVELIEGRPIVSHWVARPPHAPRDRSSAPSPDPAITMADLRTLLAEASLGEGFAADAAFILDRLERGTTLIEYRREVARYVNALGGALAMMQALSRAEWLPEADREAWAARLVDAVARFRQPATREDGLIRLAAIRAARGVIDRLDSLQASRADFPALAPAFLAALRSHDAEMAAHTAAWNRLAVVLDRMGRFAEARRAAPDSPALRRAFVKLRRQYEAAERALIDRLAAAAVDVDARADPAMATLLADHAESLADLERIGEVERWMAAMRVIHPGSAEAFAAQAGKMVDWLLDSNHRPDAQRAMAQLEAQLAMFHPLPFEAELSAGSPRAVELTGGNQDRLLAEIARQRTAWAQAWGDGDGCGSAANDMLVLHRLLMMMQDVDHLLGSERGPLVLDRWVPWGLGAKFFESRMELMTQRVASAALIGANGDLADLRREMERLEEDAAVARLAGRLAGMMNEAMLNLPGGAAGALGRLAMPPGEDAFWRDRRAELARLSRLALELHWARDGDHAARLDELAGYLRALSMNLLGELCERRGPWPTLSGFDGSDPNPTPRTER